MLGPNPICFNIFNMALFLGLQFPNPKLQVPSAALGLSQDHGKGQKVFCAALGLSSDHGKEYALCSSGF